MKFTFKNIGPVKKAELALGNLTIIAGRNNTGKSYIAHTLYSFLSLFRSDAFTIRMLNTVLNQRSAIRKGKSALLQTKKENGKIVVMQKDAESFFKSSLKGVIKDFCKNMHSFFSVAEDDFAGAGFSCETLRFPTHSKGYSPYFSNHTSSFSLGNGRFEIVIKQELPSLNAEDLALQEVLLFYMSEFLDLSPTIMSAERMSIPIFYKELDMSKNQMVEFMQNNADKKTATHDDIKKALKAVNKNAARYSRSIGDNIDFTRDIEHIQKTKGEFANSKLIDEVKSIVGGHYLYAKNQILFIPKPNGGGKKAIPLHSASSSAQCFALLYFYLRHTAQKGQLLIIDEPEAHLDTANQIKLARLLARCVNAGLKVLITTHSDYLVKEINNLIMLSYKSIKHKAELLKAIKYGEGDEIKKEDVKAYICEKGGLTPCDIDARGMDMPVFDKTIDDINTAARTLTLHLPENA